MVRVDKVIGRSLACTAIMLNDHSNPYIESTTVLSDKDCIIIPSQEGPIIIMMLYSYIGH